MKIKKRVLAHLPYCYAVSPIQAGGSTQYLYATDDRGACVCIHPTTQKVTTVWDSPGGTMSIVPIPEREGEFLASQQFLPGFCARHARIVRAVWSSTGWVVTPWLDMPYVHRFDILSSGGAHYLLCCILCDTQQESADFSAPGYLLVGKMGDNFAPPAHLERLEVPMPINHGYWPVKSRSGDHAYVGCDTGVFHVVPPGGEQNGWTVDRVLDTHTSDIALADLDGDGQEELAVIEPFHGNQFVVYHKTTSGYQEVYRHPTELEFIHALWGGTLLGEYVFLCGSRGLAKELFFLRYQKGAYFPVMVEHGFGPSNVTVLSGVGPPKILVANREAGECAEFTLTSWQ